MIAQTIKLLLSNLTPVLFIVALVAASLSKKPGPRAERYLSWLLLLSVGVASPDVPPALQGLVCAAATAAAAGYEGAHHYLVRPDGYLALSTRGDDASPIFEALRRLLPA